MGSSDFYVDFNLETDDVDEQFTREANQRLRALASEDSDIVGTAVHLEEVVVAETPYRYQVTVTVYMRPDTIAVSEKAPAPLIALKNAMDSIERIIHDTREMLGSASFQPGDEARIKVMDLRPEEVFATYVKGEEPSDLLNQGRSDIASRLMVKEGLDQEAAYFAADKILQAAAKNVNS